MPGMIECNKDITLALADPGVWTFFYGSYINLNVLREVNYVPEKWEVARLAGFDICIQPRANLVRSDQHSVYGILATGTHADSAACMPTPRTFSVRHICPKPFSRKRAMDTGVLTQMQDESVAHPTCFRH
jgi:hypothetical protein